MLGVPGGGFWEVVKNGVEMPKISAARRCRWYGYLECARRVPTGLAGLRGSKRCLRICRLPSGRPWLKS